MKMCTVLLMFDVLLNPGMASSELDARSPLLLLKDRTDTFACTLLELVQIDAGVRCATPCFRMIVPCLAYHV
jgi:hypothetical protein